MGLQQSIDGALRLVKGLNPLRLVYKRTSVATGGDSLLGIGVSSASSDVLLTPQPAYSQLNDMASVLSSSNRVLEATDYQFILSGSSVAVTDLENRTMCLVFKGPGTVIEVLDIIGYDPSEYQGVNVAYTVYTRSRSRS